jgi:prepilin-type N-terminal cleavage/methylation domain-containing protein
MRGTPLVARRQVIEEQSITRSAQSGTHPALLQAGSNRHHLASHAARDNRSRRINHMRFSAKKGFTLIELLIVVVIIGILAAIAIPKFSNTKDKAKLASVKTDLRNYQSAQEAYFSDNQTYGTFDQLKAEPYSFVLTVGNEAKDDDGDKTGYKLTVENSSISSGAKSCTVVAGGMAEDKTKDGVIDCGIAPAS